MAEKPIINKQNIATEIAHLTAQMASLWERTTKHEENSKRHKRHAYALLARWQQANARRFILKCATQAENPNG